MPCDASPAGLAYVAILSVAADQPDALGVVDLDPSSSSYGKLIGRTSMPNAGDELHHFGCGELLRLAPLISTARVRAWP
jgi:selenium-binding protein 1